MISRDKYTTLQRSLQNRWPRISLGPLGFVIKFDFLAHRRNFAHIRDDEAPKSAAKLMSHRKVFGRLFFIWFLMVDLVIAAIVYGQTQFGPNHRVTIGEIISLYGAPSYVQFSPRADTILLRYRTLDIVVRMTGTRLSLNLNVMSITLNSSGSQLAIQPRWCTNLVPSDLVGQYGQVIQCPWQGFVSIEKYFASN